MINREADVIKSAILNEQEGFQFYSMAAERAEDMEIKGVFRFLAGDEEKHEILLRKTLDRVLGNTSPVYAISHREIDSPGIFSREKLKGTGSLLVSALHIGVLMERESIGYYRDAALKTNQESLRKIYEVLAGWEQSHLDTLEAAYEYAKSEWWERQGFSPS